MARRHSRTLVVLATSVGLISAVSWLSGSVALAALQQSSSLSIRAASFEGRRDAFLALIGTDRDTYLAGGIPNIGAFVRSGLAVRKEADADRRRGLLIELLGIENATVAAKEADRRRRGLEELPPAERFTEEYVNYYGDVIAAIAALEDVRSVGVLVGAITTGSMAIDTLVSFGAISVGPVADRLTDDPDPMVRRSAAFTLSEMLRRSGEVARSPEHRAKIKKALLAAAKDSDPFVRARAVRGLARLGDPESIDVVERLASTDPYFSVFSGPQGRYVVREAAAEALKDRR